MVASWGSQLVVTLRRNFTIKWRDIANSFSEIFLPVLIIFLLIVIKNLFPTAELSSEPATVRTDMSCESSGQSAFGGASICLEADNRNSFLSFLPEQVFAYVPQNPLLEKVVTMAVQEIQDSYHAVPPMVPKGFEDEEDLYEFRDQLIFAAVIFEGISESTETLPLDIKYTIRVNGSLMPQTLLKISAKDDCRPPMYYQTDNGESNAVLSECPSHKYLTSGFLVAETALSHALTLFQADAMKVESCTALLNGTHPLSAHAVQMPLPPLQREYYSSKFELFVAMYMAWAFLPLLQITLTQIVQEKESLLKDCMILMGLRESVYWLGWFLTHACMAALTTLAIVYSISYFKLFSNSHLLLLMLIIFPYSLSLITMAFAASILFTQARKAGAFAGVLTLLSSALIVPIDVFHFSTLPCLPFLLSLSPVGFTMAIDIVTRAEGAGNGLTSLHDLWTLRTGVDPGDPDNPFSLLSLILLLVFNTLFYSTLAWYLDNVWVHPERGQKKKWDFVFDLSYWFPSMAQQYSPLLDDSEIELSKMEEVPSAIGDNSLVDVPPSPAPVPPESDKNAELNASQQGTEDDSTTIDLSSPPSSAASEKLSAVLQDGSEQVALSPSFSGPPSEPPLHRPSSNQELLLVSPSASSSALPTFRTVRTALPVVEPADPGISKSRAVLVLEKLRKVYRRPFSLSLFLENVGVFRLLEKFHLVVFVRKWLGLGGGNDEVYYWRRGRRGRERGWGRKKVGSYFGGGSSSVTPSAAGWKSNVEAVKGIDLTLYEGQTFAFLGHGGSGKSTVMNMLSGFTRPTSGEGYLHGFRLTQAESVVKSLVGICPQRNIVQPLLTVREQLSYFLRIKGDLMRMGRHIEESEEESLFRTLSFSQKVETMMGDIGLLGWANKRAEELLPSQQRKLSVALAMIGGPQVLLLDEPTIHMDPSSRKQIWDLFEKLKKGRVIAFTTHSMAEADVAADKKAILSHGVLKCCGSSQFLRKRFGLSYLLHVYTGEFFNHDAFLSLVNSHVPSASLLTRRRMAHHAAYQLPMADSHFHLAELISEIAEKSREMGVTGGALEATTLEDVFMKLQEEGEEEATSQVSLGDSSVEPFTLSGFGYYDGTDGETGRRGRESGRGSEGGIGRDDEDEDLLLGDRSSRTMGAATAGEEMRRLPSISQQNDAMWETRVKSYKRSFGSLLSVFGMPVAFALAAFILQSIYHHPIWSAMPLQDPALANSIPIYFSTSKPEQSKAALSLLSSLGSNTILYEGNASVIERQTKVLSFFEADELNVLENAGGSKAVGIHFDDLDLTKCSAQYTVVFQPWHIHQLPVVTSMVDNAIYQKLLSSSPSYGPYAANPPSLHVVNHPLQYDHHNYFIGFVVSVFVCIGLLLVPPMLSAKIIAEREGGLRSFLTVSGLRSYPYWSSSFKIDCLSLYLAEACIILLGLMFDHPPFLPSAIFPILLVFLFATPALVLLSYTLSFSFDSPQIATSYLSVFLFLYGFVPFVIVLGMPFPKFFVPHAVLSCIDPPYALFTGLHFISSVYVAQIWSKYISQMFLPPNLSVSVYFSVVPQTWPYIVSALGLGVSALFLVIRLWSLDARENDPQARGQGDLTSMAGPDGEREESEGVIKERNRVQEACGKWDVYGERRGSEQEADGVGDLEEGEGDLILCSSMGKNFGSDSGFCGLNYSPGKWVLRNIWLGVARGEIVVIVGGEKSGKSSLLHCLSGSLPLSYGDALLNGRSVRYSSRSMQRENSTKFSLCPQNDDVLFPNLTIREHLTMFAGLKGLPEPVTAAVDDLIVAMKLSEQSNTLVHMLKSSDLRKLSVAIALIGNPPVLLLDEPTAGMDIESKRNMWQRLREESSQRATLICTQSLEEAEALGQGTRVGILVEGELKCLGSPQFLKQQYGTDYTLMLTAPSSRFADIHTFLKSLFPDLPENEDDNDEGISSLSTLLSLSPSLAPSSPTGKQREGGPSRGAREAGGSSIRRSVKVRLPIQGLEQLAMLLRALEGNRARLGVTEYTVSQPTLQQVFYRLSRGKALRTDVQ